MTIYFTTDYSVNDKGFRATWKEVNWTSGHCVLMICPIRIYSFHVVWLMYSSIYTCLHIFWIELTSLLSFLFSCKASQKFHILFTVFPQKFPKCAKTAKLMTNFWFIKFGQQRMPFFSPCTKNFLECKILRFHKWCLSERLLILAFHQFYKS